MLEKEKSEYLASRTAEIEAAVDAGFQRLYGRSYNNEDMRRAPIIHGQQNGDGSKHQKDSWAQIQRDFPSLFGRTGEP